MINIAICDDEITIVSQIEEMIIKASASYGIPVETDVFYSGESLEKEILKGTQYDLLYLDIQMKGEDGITAAQNIRKMDENLFLIYVSGYEKKMRELFRLDVFDFINKPIVEEYFVQTFLAASERIYQKGVYYSFQYEKEEHKVLCSDILYFESKGRQIFIHMKEEKTAKFNGKISEVEKELKNSKIPFLRIHQSYLVHYHYIKSRTKAGIILINGERLSISDERQKQFAQVYGNLLRGEISE